MCQCLSREEREQRSSVNRELETPVTRTWHRLRKSRSDKMESPVSKTWFEVTRKACYELMELGSQVTRHEVEQRSAVMRRWNEGAFLREHGSRYKKMEQKKT